MTFRVGLLFLCILSLGTATAAVPLDSVLSEPVENARATAPALAVSVVDLASHQMVYEYRAERPMILASNTKLITTAAALEYLGPGFQYETPLLIRGRVEGGVLFGDVAVVGSGDPNISGRHRDGDPLAIFRDWARALKGVGIERVEGDLLLAHGRFDDQRVHPDWPENQLSRWYEAAVEALSFSDNCVLVRIRPGRTGGKARVQILPDLNLFEVDNRALTTTSSKRHWVTADRVGDNRIVITGKIWNSSAPIDVWLTVADPVEYFGAALRRALADEGLPVTGAPRAVETLGEGPWWRVTSFRSDLMTTLEVTNQRSQNFFAESLLKTLGKKICGAGSWSAGLKLLGEFLRKVGVTGSYELADGSGMSRNNRFSAAQVTRLLAYAHGRRWYKEYLRSLPYGGLADHHRWRTRLAEEPYRENVIAKTGSLRGVSTLSGYAKAVSGKVYAFSILCNEVRNISAARRAQDRIVRALVDHG